MYVPMYGIFARRPDAPIGLYFKDAQSEEEAKQYLMEGEGGMSAEEAENALHYRSLNLPNGYLEILLHQSAE